MITNIFKVLISVKAKLFFGFFSMVVIIALLGGYAFSSITNASDVVEETYDKPLMAINFARSASQVFGQLEISVLKEANSSNKTNEPSFDTIIQLLEEFKEDLSVAKERSISSRATPFFDDIFENLSLWETATLGPNPNASDYNKKAAQTYADIIKEQLDIIVELQMNESFRVREQSINKMDRIKRYNLLAVSLALLITLLLSAWIAITIIKPLKSAAIAARKISAGNFNASIPQGGEDETGVLLKTMAVMQNNIRERVGREQSAKTLAQDRLSDSLRNSKDAILLTNEDSVIIVANPRVKSIFPSLSAIDLVGESFSEHFNEGGYSLNDKAIFLKDSHEIKFTDNRWARVSASKTQEGGFLYIWTDITEVKKYAEELTLAKEEAEAADKAKTLFLAAMSHELRTPLNAVIGFSDALKSQFTQPGGNPDYIKMISLISKSGAQLLNIVKDILMVADTEKVDDTTIDKTEIDMLDVVNSAVGIASHDANEKNIRLLWEPSGGSYSVMGDYSRLERLLLNLLSNGIKYNDESGLVKVKLSQTESNEIRLDIIDNGIGIKDADISRIMEPFVQVDIGHTRKYDGVGVGLTLVNKIVRSHGGRVKIMSKLGQGTCVSVYLPFSKNSQSSPAQYVRSKEAIL